MNVETALTGARANTDYNTTNASELDTALDGLSVEIPAGTTVRVLEDKPDVHYLVLSSPK